MKEIVLPELGEGVTEATLVSWQVEPGNSFESGAVIAEIMTDKVSMEIEAEEAGTLREIIVSADEEVRIGTVLGRYDPAEGGN